MIHYKLVSSRNAITSLDLISSPGHTNYCTYRQLVFLCRNKAGRGYYVLSTSKGFLSSDEALSYRIGGELLLRIYF